jgi:hypothetical protein
VAVQHIQMQGAISVYANTLTQKVVFQIWITLHLSLFAKSNLHPWKDKLMDWEWCKIAQESSLHTHVKRLPQRWWIYRSHCEVHRSMKSNEIWMCVLRTLWIKDATVIVHSPTT